MEGARISVCVLVKGWAVRALALELRGRDRAALSLEVGPRESAGGFQADKIRKGTAGCVSTGAGRNMVSGEALGYPMCALSEW